MNLDYVFEIAVVELERVCDLLEMHIEFSEECPRGDVAEINGTQAAVLAVRAEQHEALIHAAYDKVEEIAKDIESAMLFRGVGTDRKELEQ